MRDQAGGDVADGHRGAGQHGLLLVGDDAFDGERRGLGPAREDGGQGADAGHEDGEHDGPACSDTNALPNLQDWT